MNTKKMLIAIAAASFSLNAVGTAELAKERKVRPCKQFFVIKTEDGVKMVSESEARNYSENNVMFAIAKSPDAKLSSEDYKAIAECWIQKAASKELKKIAIDNQLTEKVSEVASK